MLESARRRDLEKASRALQQRNENLKKRHRLLSMLRSVDYVAKHRITWEQQLSGTTTWLLLHTEYLEWLSSPSSDCIYFFGIPGSGKSVLAASIIEALFEKAVDSGNIVCYYHLNYADHRSLDLESVLGSLIKQVLVRLPLDYFDNNGDFIIEKYSSGSFEDVRDIFLRAVSECSNVYVVLDGLDQLDRDGQYAVLNLVELLLQSSTVVVKVFATCQPEEDLVRSRLKKYRCPEITPSQTADAIALLVHARLATFADEDNPVLKDPSIRKDVADALLRGAKGM